LFTPGGSQYSNIGDKVAKLLEPGESALAVLQVGMGNKILTDRRLLFLDVLDSKIKEFIPLEKVERFTFTQSYGAVKLGAEMKDGSAIKIGAFDAKWLDSVKPIFESGEAADFVVGAQVKQEPSPVIQEETATLLPSGPRTNSMKAFPNWLQGAIASHKRANEELLMVITEPYTNHQGAMLVFEDRCMIVKGGFWGGLMAGSLGGERAATFYLTQITGIEYNSGMLTGVLEVLTPSYQGTTNKDYWRGTNQSRNANSNDPWTLSNTLPLSKDGYRSAREMIDELKQMIAAAQRPSGVMQAAVQDLTGELSKLAALRDSGILTDEEFSAAKAKLLS